MQAILALLLQLASVELFKRVFIGVLEVLHTKLKAKAEKTPELDDDTLAAKLLEFIDYCKRQWGMS